MSMLFFNDLSGTRIEIHSSHLAMTQYRFITPNRRGKWYPSLGDAQARANAIGAGYLDASGNFVAYRGTVLEFREKAPA